MKLIIILLCLGLERYLKIGALLKRFHWFDCYLKSLKRFNPFPRLHQSWQGLALIVLPLSIIFGVLFCWMRAWLYGLIGFLITFFALLYCLGPDDLYHQVTSYFHSSENKNKSEEKDILTALLGKKPPQKISAQHRAVTNALFTQANDRLFAVLFWFVLLGPIGAVFYRTVAITKTKSVEWDKVDTAAASIQNLLNWIPARLVALVYILVGNFRQSFNTWLKQVFSGLKHSEKLLIQVGSQATDIDKDETKSNLKENKEVLAMFDRSLIVVLVVIAIFTLGAWIS